MDGPPGWLLTVLKDRRVAFLLVGAVNTVVGGLWFVLFDTLVGPAWNGAGHYVALVLTYVASILCAFVLYRRIVFRVHGHWWRDLVRFSSVYVFAFFLNLALFAVLFSVLGFEPIVAQLVNILVIAVVSYLLHGRFSFRRTADPAGVSE